MASKQTKNSTLNSSGKQKTGNIPAALILFLTGLCILFIFLLNNVSHIQDDAFISFRYIKNFVNGNGLVFNPGERVEGYTNFLWTLILSVPAFLKMNIVSISQYLSSLFGILIIITVFLLAKQLHGKHDSGKVVEWFAVIPAFLLVLTGAFTYWAVSGMETSFFIFLITAAVYCYLKEKDTGKINYYTPLLLALAALTRPEGILIAAIIYIHKFIFAAKEKTADRLIKKMFTRSNLVELSIWVVPVVLHFIFRLTYYGYLFPNTFYAKTGNGFSAVTEGLQYFTSFAKDYLLYGFILLIALISLFQKEKIFENSLLILITVIYSLYVILIGGDVLPLHRFWLIILPFVYILLSNSLLMFYNYIVTRKLMTPGNAAAALFIFIIVTGGYNYISNKDNIKMLVEREINLVAELRRQAEIINQLGSLNGKKITVAATTIGSLSYYTDANVIDMLGLTDEYIAHNPEVIEEISNDPSNPWKEKKYNARYVVSRKPDYFLFSTGIKPSAYAERALFATPAFFNNYYIQFLPMKGMPHLYLYAGKNQLQQDETNGRDIPEKINPRYISYYVSLLQAYTVYQKTKNEESLNDVKNKFNVAVNRSPVFFAEPYRIMGDAYSIAGNMVEAEKNYNKALSIDSLSVLSYLGLGSLYQSQNKTQQADNCMRLIKEHGLIDDRLFRLTN